MGKFTEPAYFLLDHYFESLNTQIEDDIKSKIVNLWPVVFTDWDDIEYLDYNNIVWNFEYETVEGPYSKKQVDWSYNGSYLTGGNKGIIAIGDKIVQLFVKDNDYGFREIFVTPPWEYKNGNFFNFKKHITLQYQYGSTLSETLSGNAYYFEVYKPTITFDPQDINDKEVYFRKDSQFHRWLTDYARDYFNDLWGEDFVIRNYVNTDKQFLYFGKIFHRRDDTYHIEFYGMKDFVMNAIPYHQRTPKLTKFMEVEFDRNFQEIYNLLKNIWSMIDPYEVDEKYLGYLAKFYNINVDSPFDILNQREFIRELTNYLKRKGSYSSFYSAWKVLTQGTKNDLYIYDKWIKSSDVLGDGNVNPDNFVVVPYTDQYTDSLLNADDYILTPYYKIQLDISTESIQYNQILSKSVIDNLLYHFEELRPVNKVPEYEILLTPEVYLDGRLSALFYGDIDRYNVNVLSRVRKFTIAVNNSHIQIFGGGYYSFLVNHNLNSNHMFIKCYDMNFNEIVPASVDFIDGDNIRVTFDHSETGFMLLRKPDLTSYQLTDVDNWLIKHPFSQKEVYVEFNKDKEKIYVDETILVDNNFISTNLKSGEANIAKPDLVYIQSVESDEWDINHNLKYKGVLISCFDINNNEIIPKDVEFIDINNSVITFDEPISGYAIIVSVGNPMFADMLIERVIEDGEEKFLLPFYEINSVINNFETYDYKSRVNSSYETEEALYLVINVPEDVELTMKELRIYDSSDNILIYTECGDIYKPMGVKMKIEYKVNKYTTKGSL